MQNLITRLFAVTLLLSVALCTISCKGKKSKSPSSPPPLKIESATAYSSQLRDKMWFATSTKPKYSITIEPRIAGTLSLINFGGGEYIDRDALLFRIDPSQINTSLYIARANLESAHAEEIEAKSNYERAIPLSRINAISQSTLDSYTANYSSAKAAVKSAQEQLRSAELELSYTYITAPISGSIAESIASVGDYVGVGTKFSTLTTISAIDTLQVDLEIPLSKYLKYTPHNSSPRDNELLTNITITLADSTLYPIKGEYAYTKSSGANGSSTVVIVANFANPNKLLKQNTFARISADIGAAQSRVMIPAKSVLQMQGVNSVWVIKPDSTVTLRRITLSSSNGLEWGVSDGIKSGERVATTGLLKLHEGAPIRFNN